MRQPLHSACFVVVLILLCQSPIIECQSTSCTTPQNQPGKCVRVEKCSNIFKILERAKTQSIPPHVMSYIEQARCTLPGVTAHAVCCQLKQVQVLPTECGVATQERISNGNKTNVFEFPWMALLRYDVNGEFEDKCGGTLINSRYILTAAHCIKTRSTFKLDHVRLGEHTKQNHTDCIVYSPEETVCAEPVRDYKIESSVVHPEYSLNKYDIGLLRLAEEVEFDSHIAPICLPTTRALEDTVPNKYIVAGWGTTENGSMSDILLKASVPPVNVTYCESVLNQYTRFKFRLDKNIHICAGGEGLVDSCSGDSGGPLMAPAKLDGGFIRFVQFGVVSRGVSTCGDISAPGAYTKVAGAMQWILDNMAP